MEIRRGLCIAVSAVSAAMILAGLLTALSVSDGYQKGRRKYQEWKDRYTSDAGKDQGKDENEGAAEKSVWQDKNESAAEKNAWKDELISAGLSEDAPYPAEVDFDGLSAVNSDVVGWIELPAADISYPVVQAADNEFYLHRSLDREELFAGSLFLDAGNAPDFSDNNSIIYGHNMRDGSMFAKLQNYCEQTVYEKCPYFWIYTPDGAYLYQIYSVHTVFAGSSAFRLSFHEPLSYADWLKQMYASSEVKASARMEAKGRTVTLSTCTSDPQERQIVQGMQIAGISGVGVLQKNNDREDLEVKLW